MSVQKLLPIFPWLTAVLWFSVFPPVGFWPLVFVAWVPLLTYVHVRRASTKSLLNCSVALFAGACIAFLWLRHVFPVAPIGVAIMPAVYVGMLGLGIRWGADRMGLPFWWLSAILMVGCDYLRSYLFGGWPFYQLGHGFADSALFRQSADLIGATGIGILPALVSAFIAAHVGGSLVDAPESGDAETGGRGDGGTLEMGSTPRRGWRRPGSGALLTVLGVLLLFSVYGFVRPGTVVTEVGPDLAVIQGNIPQEIKNEIHLMESAIYTRDQYFRLTELATQNEPKPDMRTETGHGHLAGNDVSPRGVSVGDEPGVL
jgi:apolipoprotein N-acyltransferase